MGRIIRKTMSERFNGFIVSSIVSSIIMGIAGLIMFFLPALTNKLIGIIIGALILISGANTIYKYFQRDGAKLYTYNFIFGMILFILGLVIILVPFSVTSFITVCLGLYLVILGANKISYGVWLKVGSDPAWLLTFVIGAMLVLFGVLVLANPFSALTITKIVGIFLIITSILDITNMVLIKKRSSDISKIFW